MNRRDFLTATTAAVLLGPHSRGSETSGLAKPSREIIPAIDTHTHFYDPTRPGGVPWPRPDEVQLYRPHLPETFAEVVRGLPVVGTVVVEASPWLEDNQWLLDLAAKHPSIVGIVGNVRPGDPTFAANLRRFAQNPLFRGVRVGLAALKGSGTPAVDDGFARLADADLALDVLGGVPILEPTLRLARRWPALRIVIDHLPFAAWDANVPALRTALAELAQQRNVTLKVSEIVRQVDGRVVEDPAFYRPTLDALLDLFGPDRLVYGSNWPVSQRVASYDVVYRVALAYFSAQGRSTAERFFWRNSLDAYRWVRRGAAATLGRE